MRKRTKKAKLRIVQWDYMIFFAYLALCGFGLYMNLNISSVNETTMITFIKQLGWFLISLVAVYATVHLIDIQKIKPIIPVLTLINLILLIMVLYFGTEIKGATRSFRIGGINFQPSLPMRVTLILYFAYILDKKKDLLEDSYPLDFLKNFKQLAIITALSFAIILKGRHLSVIIISAATLFSMLWIARIRLVTLMLIGFIALVGGMVILSRGASYRESRMEIFTKYSLFHRMMGIDVESIQADDYQIRESLISLSQGKLLGTSSVFGQAKNRYLPESATDYIFSVIGEEYGFLGSLVIFGLYIIIFFRGLLGSWKIDDFFLRMVGIGLTLNVFFNAFVNIGVAISALPSTGVTLPFISYGGTSMLTNSICIGLILNITAVRKTWQGDS